MIAVKVLNLGEIREVGEKKTKIQKVTVENMSTKETMVVDVFLGKKGMFDFTENDQITMPVENKQYKGKDQFSAPGWKCQLLEAAPEVKEEPKAQPTKYSAVSEDVWAEKDKRMARMNALRHAVEIVKAEKIDLADGGMLDAVKHTADELVDYVYNGIVEADDQAEAAPADEEMFPCE